LLFWREKMMWKRKEKTFLVKLHLNVTERVTDRRTHSQMFGTENQVLF
jgi:hypothetical protein